MGCGEMYTDRRGLEHRAALRQYQRWHFVRQCQRAVRLDVGRLAPHRDEFVRSADLLEKHSHDVGASACPTVELVFCRVHPGHPPHGSKRRTSASPAECPKSWTCGSAAAYGLPRQLVQAAVWELQGAQEIDDILLVCGAQRLEVAHHLIGFAADTRVLDDRLDQVAGTAVMQKVHTLPHAPERCSAKLVRPGG